MPHPPPRLVELLFGAYRRRILGLLLLHPQQSFYVREIMRLTGVPSGSLHRELTALNAAGLLMRNVTGSQVCYQADRSCPLFEELAGIFRKTSGLADVMVLGSASFERVVEALMPVGARLRREINPVVMTPEAFLAKLKARDRFASRVACEPKLFITGDAGELGEPAQDRAARGALPDRGVASLDHHAERQLPDQLCMRAVGLRRQCQI